MCVCSCLCWGRFLSEYTCLFSKLANRGLGFQRDLSVHPAGPMVANYYLRECCQATATAGSAVLLLTPWQSLFFVAFSASIEACQGRCPVVRGWPHQLSMSQLLPQFQRCADGQSAGEGLVLPSSLADPFLLVRPLAFSSATSNIV